MAIGGTNKAVLLAVLVMAMATFASGQQNRPPRLEHPDLVPAEKPTEITKQLDPVYDKTKDETTHFLSGLMVIGETPGHEVQVPGESQKRTVPSAVTKMVVYYKTPGKTKVRPSEVVLAINYGNAFGFEFTEHRDLSILLENEKIELGKMNLVSKRNEGYRPWGFIRYWESLEAPIQLDVYKKIVESKSVSIKIGGGTATLTGAQIKQLRKYSKDLD